MTFAAYATRWLEGFIDDAPDRARFEAALEHRLLPALGDVPLLEVLDAAHDGLHGQLLTAGGGGDDDATMECLRLILEDAAAGLREALGVTALVRKGRAGP